MFEQEDIIENLTKEKEELKYLYSETIQKNKTLNLYLDEKED